MPRLTILLIAAGFLATPVLPQQLPHPIPGRFLRCRTVGGSRHSGADLYLRLPEWTAFERAYRDPRRDDRHFRALLVGLVHRTKPLLGANRGTGAGASNVVVFDTTTRKLLQRIPVEVNPYALVLSDNGQTLYVSNWGSDSVSVIDVETLQVTGRIRWATLRTTTPWR